MRDEKLKKGQIRIIVIATGFPEGESSNTGVERSLFAMEPKEQQETKSKIFGDALSKREEPLPEPVRENIREETEIPSVVRHKEEPIVTAQPRRIDNEMITPPAVDEDDDTWGAIPSFLRRHKK